MKSSSNPFNSFADFLNDKHFVHWKLFPTDESEAYWNDFLKQNPHLEPLLREAEKHFVNIKIEKDELSDKEKYQLWQNICHSASTEKRTSTVFRQRWLQIAVAAVAFFIGLNVYLSKEKQTEKLENHELIVGSLLNSEDIQLVTGESALSFQNNVQMQIHGNGKVKISQENQTDKTINITQRALNKIIVPYGKRTQLTLSDGSRAWLNSGSVLEFPAQFADNQREIRLTSGEMYIEVAPDKKKSFFVHTSNFSVKVYGTKFNISAYTDSSPSVVLVEGSVSLKANNQKEQILAPDEQAIYSGNGMFERQKVDVSKFIGWKNGYLEFENTPMVEVLKQIGRYYNLSFSYKKDVNLQKRSCSGKIYLSDNLDNVMTTVALLSSTHYQKENNRIYIANEIDYEKQQP